MGTLYLLVRGYFPGLAANNHYLAWFKCFDKVGIKATIVTLRPNDNFDLMPNDYCNITIHNLWENNIIKTNIRTIRFIQHYCNLFRFVRNLKSGDIVWMYDLPEALFPLVRIKGVKVYNEITEYPQFLGCSCIKRYLLNIFLKNIRHIDGLFVISTSLRRFFIEKGVDSEKVSIINMNVEPERFEGLKRDTATPYIAYCGNGSNNKDGVDQLIKAFALVHKAHPNYYLYIIGQIPEPGDVSGNYELVEKLNIKEHVVFLGKRSPEEIPQLLKNAKLLALDRPSSIQADNGFPNKLGEYLLTGNPVCVTDVGDIPLFLQDGVSALIAKHDDIKSFASKLAWAIENEEESRRIGAEGEKVARIHFNPMTESRKMLNIMGYK